MGWDGDFGYHVCCAHHHALGCIRYRAARNLALGQILPQFFSLPVIGEARKWELSEKLKRTATSSFLITVRVLQYLSPCLSLSMPLLARHRARPCPRRA
jgi:hypothetical protein